MPVTPAPRSHIAIAYAAVSLVWGSTYFAIRVALEEVPPFLVGALRFLVAGAILFVALWLRGVRPPRGVEWLSAALTGSLFFVIGNGFVNMAELSVSSGLVSILVATMPLWATLLARLTGERPSWQEQAGIALGLGGVAVMNLGADLRASGMGAVWALCAPLGWSVGTVLSRRLPLPPGPMASAAQMLTGGAALLAVSLTTGERFPVSPSARSIEALGYLAIFGSLIGFSAYTFLLNHTRASVATSYAYVNPVVAVALGVALAGERMDRTTALGALVVLGAVLLVTRGRSARQEAQTSASPAVAAKVTVPVAPGSTPGVDSG